MPSESAASRICAGTRRSISSVVRTTTGSTMKASATAPAKAEKCPIGATTSVYTNRPSTMEGADSRMSLTKRIVSPRRADQRVRANSARYVPASTPIGAPNSTPSRLIRMLPNIALSRPPSSPGGGVILVKRSRSSAEMPLRSVVHTIHVSQNRPKIVAIVASTWATMFFTRRAPYRPEVVPNMSVAFLAGELAEHQAGDRQHDEGDEEQHEAECDQRGAVHLRIGFGEFVGDGRGDGVARHEQRRGELMRVAEHEGHCHRFAERAA